MPVKIIDLYSKLIKIVYNFILIKYENNFDFK